MAAEWYYAKGKQKHGPLTEAQLQELAASGELLPSDVVWKQGMQAWVKAGSLTGFFPDDGPPPLPAAASDTPEDWKRQLWNRVWANKLVFFSLCLFLSLILTFILPEVFVIVDVGLLITIAVLGVSKGLMAADRNLADQRRRLHLHGPIGAGVKKWEPVSGAGPSLWFFEDGGFMRSDGFGAKYSFDTLTDIITITVSGFGTPIPLKVLSLTEHEFVISAESQALHYQQGRTISGEKAAESWEKKKEFLKNAALVTAGAVGTAATAALAVLVIGAGVAVAAGAAAGTTGGGGSEGGGDANAGLVRCTLCGGQGVTRYTYADQMKENVCSGCYGRGWVKG